MKSSVKLIIVLLVSHFMFFGIGFGAGIYFLPVLTASQNATSEDVQQVKDNARYFGHFTKNQKGSNAVHWADGKLYVSNNEIAFEGSVAPGPDYKIYLTKTRADDRDSFLKIKDDALYIGDLKNFGNFQKTIPEGVNIDDYTTVQIWCERFGQFISSASYQ